MRQNFKQIDIFAGFHPQNGMEWQKENGITANWKTPEQIQVKPVYTKEDLEGMEHLNYAAGIPPYLRGPYSMMYTFFRHSAGEVQFVIEDTDRQCPFDVRFHAWLQPCLAFAIE